MDSKVDQNKTIKTIVPIKGNLLEKIKNKLKHNGTPLQSREANDADNNNKVSNVPAINKKSSKIEIQKIEKVNIELSKIIKSSIPATTNSLILNDSTSKLIVTPSDQCAINGTKIDSNAFQDSNVETLIDSLNDDARKEQKTEIKSSQSEKIKSKKQKVEMHEKKTDDTIDRENYFGDVSEEEEEGECMDIGNEVWINDISVMIGESRIREIDDSLKKIPIVVTGNRIQTENLELKLIINHLLEKLNAKSVIETLDNSSTSLFKESKDDIDYYDSFGDPTTEMSDDDSSSHPDAEKPASSLNKQDNSVAENNSFSVPLDNNIAIITVPSVENIVSQKVTTDQELNHIKADVSTNVKELAKKRKDRPLSLKAKKRKGRPLSSLKAKKTKVTASGKSIKVEETVQPHIYHPRKFSLRDSSRESSIESTKEANKMKSPVNNQETESKIELTLNSPTLTQPSLRETLLKNATSKNLALKKSKEVTTIKELKRSENESSILRTGKKSSNSSSNSKNQTEQSQRITDFFLKKEPKNDHEKSIEVAAEKKINGKTKTDRRKNSKNLSDSKNDSESETASSKKCELKSVGQSNSNSQTTQSSIIERYDYLNKSSTEKKGLLSDNPICDELKDIINKLKQTDSTYIAPPDTVKRPYLKSSAFTGNPINFDDSSNILDSSDQLPSVSRDDSSFDNNANNSKNDGNDSNTGIKNIMKSLIKKQKEKIQIKTKQQNDISKSAETSPSLSVNSDSPKTSTQKNTNKNASKTSSGIKIEIIEKKIFEQEPLEKAKEGLVPYDEIIEAIRVSDPSRIKGRTKHLDSKKKAELERKLKDLEHFSCGNCNFLVTKHKWEDHLKSHGGLAWIEPFESPIDINNWNESVRRLNNYVKIYKVETIRCPNCNHEKRSALGHLSHIYVCGETEEIIESRKIACQFCEEKFMPYNKSFHRSKCGMLKKKEDHQADGDDEDDEASKSSSTTKESGRGQRKAGRRAIKNFKTFLERLNEDPMDHVISSTNGQFFCTHCREKFDTKEESIEHIEKNHADKKDGPDFDPSNSDASVFNENESSEETDGSSGVDSSDIQSDDEDYLSDSVNNSHFKGNSHSSHESEELKNSRKLVSNYIESLPDTKISNRTIKLIKEFFDSNMCDNILDQLSSKYKISSCNDLASYLIDLKFDLQSMKFEVKLSDNYSLDFGKIENPRWRQLNAGSSFGDKNSLTLYCGGSVSCVDWTHTKDGKTFLAVVSNKTGAKIANLEETSKTCIQVYQFEQLLNDEFSTFENSSKFLYYFTIHEGPVWSVKFHPFVVPNKNRIGLLAVTSSNHVVYIFSLPHLKSGNDPSRISLEPSIICKTSNEFWLHQEKYLMQSTIVSWFFKKDIGMHLLAAGFINGMVSVWNLDDFEKTDDNETLTLFPHLTFQPHQEPITGLDFKHIIGEEIYLLTTGLDRDVKVFLIQNMTAEEISSNYTSSRIMCAEWWINWPGFICGNDNCYAQGNLTHRQPLEFATRNLQLFFCISSITSCCINNWLNVATFSTDSGDVLSANPKQLIHSIPKDRWFTYGNNILTYTDIIDLDPNDSQQEHGIVFYDIKSKFMKEPNLFRTTTTTDNINLLQINHISFNPNEMSYRFYALAYETGFVRIKYLKNAK